MLRPFAPSLSHTKSFLYSYVFGKLFFTLMSNEVIMILSYYKVTHIKKSKRENVSILNLKIAKNS